MLQEELYVRLHGALRLHGNGMTVQRQFLKAAAEFLFCRQAEMDDDHKDKAGALMGSMDWTAEMSLIIKEWKRGNQALNRSQETPREAC
jgi:hypothetical protein